MSDKNPNGSYGGAAAAGGFQFQKMVGAFFASSLIAGIPVDHRLGLGTSYLQWIRFETEAPVDDILLATREGGYVAIQAKTSASISGDPQSPFGKTITQFVRYWLACSSGNGLAGWNRTFDVVRDRLVLAVSPKASESIRVHLPAALRARKTPASVLLTARESSALATFDTLVKQAWDRTTSVPFDSGIMRDFSSALLIVSLDMDGSDWSLARANLAPAIDSQDDVSSALISLSDFCSRLMMERSGADEARFRSALREQHIKLSEAPEFANDIRRLIAQTDSLTSGLTRYEQLANYDGSYFHVERDFQKDVLSAAQQDHLLVIGEPGSGKSGLLLAISRDLRSRGADVVELAVDRHSVETLEGLSKDLGLKHSIIDTLAAWDGPGSAWLVIDALDATRGGRSEGVFRALISGVMDHAPRWRIVASIRSFDLRMGSELRDAFKGVPPLAALADPAFANVRHVSLSNWTSNELSEKILSVAPVLSRALEASGEKLREITRVPFNTRLLCELIAESGGSAYLEGVATQIDLLNIYWQARVEKHGLSAEYAIAKVVGAMISSRSLRAPAILDGADPASVDALCRDGVLQKVENGRWLEFRHHLLFDFAASRVALDRAAIERGEMASDKYDELGIMLAPAFAFLLREIWESSSDRAIFWFALGRIIQAEHADPVIRSIAGRSGAEFPSTASDVDSLQSSVRESDGPKLIEHIVGSLAVRLEDGHSTSFSPWIALAGRLATELGRYRASLRFLVNLLLGHNSSAKLEQSVGNASRALFRHEFLNTAARGVSPAIIGFVAKTAATNEVDSIALLSSLLDKRRIQRSGDIEIPAICQVIGDVAAIDPRFVIDVYEAAYRDEIEDETETEMGSSRILPLRSNSRQDFEMSKYILSQFFTGFLEGFQALAIEALNVSTRGLAMRKRSGPLNAIGEISSDYRKILILEDDSAIWASDPDDKYATDAVELVSKFSKYLKSVPQAVAGDCLVTLERLEVPALIWSRVFIAMRERGDDLAISLWPLVTSEPVLRSRSLSKDAIDLISATYPRQSAARREHFEHSVLVFEFLDSHDPDAARSSLVARIFGSIDAGDLETREAKSIRETLGDGGRNPRPFSSRVGWATPAPYFWLPGLDLSAPANLNLTSAIDVVKERLGAADNSREVRVNTLDDGVRLLERIRDLSSLDGVDERLIPVADGYIASGCTRLAKDFELHRERVHEEGSPEYRYIELLLYACRSPHPTVDADTELNFESSHGWGSPASRIDAAQAVASLVWKREDLLSIFRADLVCLAVDSHPAVRMMAVSAYTNALSSDERLTRRYALDRLRRETNVAVIENLLGTLVRRLIGKYPRVTYLAVAGLLGRDFGSQQRSKRIAKSVAMPMMALSMYYGIAGATATINEWVTQPGKRSSELRRILPFLSSVAHGDPPGTARDQILGPASLSIVQRILASCGNRLEVLMISQNDEGVPEEIRSIFRLVDSVFDQIVRTSFVTNDSSSVDDNQRVDALHYLVPVLELLVDIAPPSTTYSLLEFFLSAARLDPEAAFDLTERALRASVAYGYQYEPMGADLFVRLVGIFLADHKEVFRSETRRRGLSDCLGIFMDAGWPSARRLLYRLPEVMQ